MRTIFLALSLLSCSSLLAQPARPPSADDIKAAQAKYGAEREQAVQSAAKLYPAAMMERADELAKQSAAALAKGQLREAGAAIRQARWQLPYQPPGLPNNVARILGNPRLQHGREVNAVAYSPDGSKLATASSDNTVKIWDLANGHELLTYAGHTDKVRSLVWSPDGKTITSAGFEKNIKTWDASTGKDIQTIVATGFLVSSIALSHDGKHLFTGQSNPHARGNFPAGLFVYDTKTGKLVREVNDFTNKIGTLSLNTAGNILAVGDDNGNTRLFHYPDFVAKDKQPAYWAQQDVSGATYHLSFSPDGRTLVRVGPVGVKLYNTPLPGAEVQVVAPRRTIKTTGSMTAAFSKDGKTLLVGGIEGNIDLWDPESGEQVAKFKHAQHGPIHRLVFSADGSELAVCSWAFLVDLWDFDEIRQPRDVKENKSVPLRFAPEHASAVETVAVSPNGKLIATGSADRSIKLWDRTTGTLLATLSGHKSAVMSLVFSADSNRLISSSADASIRMWEVTPPHVIILSPQQQQAFNRLRRYSPYIATDPASKTLFVWLPLAEAAVSTVVEAYDIETGNLLFEFREDKRKITSFALSANAQLAATGAADGSVRLWQMGKDKATPAPGGDWFLFNKVRTADIALAPDGSILAAGSDDGEIKIARVADREVLKSIKAHPGAVQMCLFSPDGKRLATYGADNILKLWDRPTGQELRRWDFSRKESTTVINLAFTPDGKQLITANVHPTAFVLDLP